MQWCRFFLSSVSQRLLEGETQWSSVQRSAQHREIWHSLAAKPENIAYFPILAKIKCISEFRRTPCGLIFLGSQKKKVTTVKNKSGVKFKTWNWVLYVPSASCTSTISSIRRAFGMVNFDMCGKFEFPSFTISDVICSPTVLLKFSNS